MYTLEDYNVLLKNEKESLQAWIENLKEAEDNEKLFGEISNYKYFTVAKDPVFEEDKDENEQLFYIKVKRGDFSREKIFKYYDGGCCGEFEEITNFADEWERTGIYYDDDPELIAEAVDAVNCWLPEAISRAEDGIYFAEQSIAKFEKAIEELTKQSSLDDLVNTAEERKDNTKSNKEVVNKNDLEI